MARTTFGRTAFTLLLVALAVTGMVAPAVMAETTPDPDLDDAEEPDPAVSHVQNPYVEADVTKATHEMGWGATEYEDNNGNMAELPADVNGSVNNPYNIVLSDVETGAYGEFPANSGTEDADTALNASHWTTDATSTNGTVAASDVETAPGVDAIEIDVSGQDNSYSETARAEFNEFKITSDVNKRYVQGVADVTLLGSGADVFIRYKDTDGDYVQMEIDPDDDPTVGNNVTNSTGEGFVYQRQVGELAVAGTGDGTMDNINATEVVAKDGNVTLRFAALNTERTSPWTLGQEKIDTDSDDDLETETITEVNETGGVDLHTLDSMGTIYDAATLHDLTAEMHFEAKHLADGDKLANFSEAEDYQSYDHIGNTYYRLAIPDAYDLSYANAELKGKAVLPAQRHLTVEYATATGDTDLENVTGYTDVTSQYDPKGANTSLTTAITAGENMVFHSELLYTNAEKQDFWASSSEGTEADDGGGGGGMFGSGGGGLLDGILSPVGGMISAVLVFLGIKKRRG